MSNVQPPNLHEDMRKATIISNAIAVSDKVICDSAQSEEEIIDLTLALCNALIQKSMFLVHRSRTKEKTEKISPSGSA